MNTSKLCCHWCKIPLGNATQVTYLNGNLPICDLCLSRQVTPKFEDATKFSTRITGVIYTMKDYCEFYPKPGGDTCVCDAGSDVSGTTDSDDFCSKEYSLTCQWANELRTDESAPS